jgi:hypothetical protein
MNLYYSPDFVSILKKINCEISNKILDFNGTSHLIKKELNFIDISTERLGYISFSKKKYTYNFDESCMEAIFYDKDSYTHDEFWKNSRNYLKVGRLVTKFGFDFTASQIEEFTNKFKSEVNNIKSINIQVVSGEDIRKWYNEKNYLIQNIGDLGRSCMRYDKCKEYLDIYVDNPDTCKLAIITRNNKLIARAILWKVSNIKLKLKLKPKVKFDYILDRVYSINSYDNYTLKDYAIKNNWAIRITERMFEYNNEEYYGSLEVKVKPKEYEKYPYMDTFSRFNSRKGTLYNDTNDYEIGHILKLVEGEYKKSISYFQYIKNIIML